jgi:hypothetical protein
MSATGFDILPGPSDSLPTEPELVALDIHHPSVDPEHLAGASASGPPLRSELDNLWSMYRFWRAGWGP